MLCSETPCLIKAYVRKQRNTYNIKSLKYFLLCYIINYINYINIINLAVKPRPPKNGFFLVNRITLHSQGFFAKRLHMLFSGDLLGFFGCSGGVQNKKKMEI